MPFKALTEKLAQVTNEKSNLEISLRQNLESAKEELMQLKESRDELDGENKVRGKLAKFTLGLQREKRERPCNLLSHKGIRRAIIQSSG